ncbi:DUF1499 domain-containing protein [Hellea sp.]|nr:DUF1499 domain-containing protein [Hellea sp.]
MSKDNTVPSGQHLKGDRRRTIRRWFGRLTLALTIFTPLYFIVAALGTKFGLFTMRFGFGKLTYAWSKHVLMALAIAGLVSLLLSIFIKPRKGFGVAAAALIIAIAGMGYGAGVSKKAATLPFIHDITTDTQNVPTFTDAILSERAKVKGVNSVDYIGKKARTSKLGADGKPVMKLVSVLQTQTKAYADIRPLILEDDMAVAFGEAKAAAKQLGWKLKSEDPKTGIIEATDTSFWYGFKDDVVIRLRPSEGGGTILDVRSVSRVGGSDIGANAARIRKFLGVMGKA